MAFQGDNMMDVKRNNRASLLLQLHANGNMSRKSLSEKMHLTAAAITKIVSEMESEGILVEGTAVSTGNAGRREIPIEINRNYAVALGININIRQVIISATDLEGNLLFDQNLSIAPGAPSEATLRAASGILEDLLQENSIERRRVIGIGVAVRGHLTAGQRVSSDSYGALSEKNYPICERLEALTGFPVFMENNVRALHAAQMFLSKDIVAGSTQIFLRCEYGIGSSISIDGKIWNGATQSCGEIGHITVVRKGGRPCNCGRSGCLETVASASAIRDILSEMLSSEKTPVLWELCRKKATAIPEMADISSAYTQGDPGVIMVVDRAVNELSAALEAASQIIDPDTIILYGTLFEYDCFIDQLLRKNLENNSSVEMKKSRYNCALDSRAGCILAVNQFFSNGGVLKNE